MSAEKGTDQEPGVTTALNPNRNLEPDSGKKTHKSSVQIQEPPVSETRGYSIVKIEEKHGPLTNAIPVMPFPLSIICCLLNLFLPGVGE